jgi:hypothetical protein
MSDTEKNGGGLWVAGAFVFLLSFALGTCIGVSEGKDCNGFFRAAASTADSLQVAFDHSYCKPFLRSAREAK